MEARLGACFHPSRRPRANARGLLKMTVLFVARPSKQTVGYAGLALPGRSLTHPTEPPADPFHRLAHVGGRAGVAEADEVLPARRIEVDAGRGGDARLLQHALGEVE